MKNAADIDITRTVKEWQKFSGLDIALESLLDNRANFVPIDYGEDLDKSIKDSIYLGEVDPTILSNVYRNVEPCPCDTCLKRPTCVRKRELGEDFRARVMREVCDDRLDYLRKVQSCVLQEFSYDKELQNLLERACLETYFRDQ